MLDFGAVARLPDGLPRPLSIMVRLALENRPDDLLALLRARGLRAAGLGDDGPGRASPTSRRSPSRCARRCSGSTGAGCSGRPGAWATCAAPTSAPALELNLPPQYLLVHRVTMGTLGVLCQLDADVPLRGIVRHWQPWIFDDDPADETAGKPS